MSLTKEDLGQIEKIVEKSENRIISIISREITNLSEINHAVIKKIDQIDRLEKRTIRIEHKVGLAR